MPALRPDVTIIHAQKADREGNVLIEGIVGVQKEAVLAARRAVVTVEEVVDSFEGGHPNACILPRWTIRRNRRRARRRVSVVRLRLLRARQRVLSRLGRDLAHRATFQGLARRARDAVGARGVCRRGRRVA